MIKITNRTKALIYLFLILICIGALSVFDDQDIAYKICLIAIIGMVVFTVLLILLSRGYNSSEKRIIGYGKRKKAEILATKQQRNLLILQLKITDWEEEFVTSVVIKNPSGELINQCKDGSSIEVFLNPKNKRHVVISRKREYRAKGRFTKIDVFIWGFQALVFGTIALTTLIGQSDKKFQDAALIMNADGQETLWEVFFDSPQKVFLRVYDPFRDKRLLRSKDKKDDEFGYDIEFHICKQNENVVVYGTGKTPIFDIYSTSTYKKIGSIEDLEKKYPLLNSGIAEFTEQDIHYWFLKEDVIKIVTKDGNYLFYNIEQDSLFESEENIRIYFHSYDTALLNRYQYTYALSFLENSVDKYQLYRIDATHKNHSHKLSQFAGNNNVDVNYYNKEEMYDEIIDEIKITDTINIDDIPAFEGSGSIFIEYIEPITVKSENKFKFTLLTEDEILIKAHFLYIDSTIAVISYANSVGNDAKEFISCYNKEGKKLFEIKQDDFPNLKDMEDDNNLPLRYYDMEVSRNENHIVVFFMKYGSICMDLITGETLWKHE